MHKCFCSDSFVFLFRAASLDDSKDRDTWPNRFACRSIFPFYTALALLNKGELSFAFMSLASVRQGTAYVARRPGIVDRGAFPRSSSIGRCGGVTLK